MKKSVLYSVLVSLFSLLPASVDSVVVPEPEKRVSLAPSIGFESEYTYRGALCARNATLTNWAFKYKFSDEWSLEYNLFGCFPIGRESTYGNCLDQSIGLMRKLNESMNVHSGFTYYWQPYVNEEDLGQSREWYVGLDSQLTLLPSAYAYYDFDKQQFCAETNFGYRFELEGFGFENWAIDTGFFAGVLFARNAYGGVYGENRRKNGYKYWGGKCDLVYLLAGWGDVRLGVRYVANNDGGKPDSVANEAGQHGKMCSVGGALSLYF